MTNPSSQQKNPMWVILFLFLLLSGAMGVFAYFYWTAQNVKIKSREAEIEALKVNETALSKHIQDAENEGKRLLEENTLIKQNLEKFEGEKTAILNQVRNSVSNFETFRAEATQEIESLKGSLNRLQIEKQELSQDLESTKNLSTGEKQKMTSDIEGLTKKIEDYQTMEANLLENLRAKEKSPLVNETAKLHYNLGNFYYRNGNYKSAANEYTKAIFYEPLDADAHWNLAVVSDENLDDRKMAVKHYRQYLELCPKSASAKKIEQRILDIEMTMKVLEEDPAITLKRKAHKEGVFVSQDENTDLMKVMQDK